jgi:hypothetical protein
MIIGSAPKKFQTNTAKNLNVFNRKLKKYDKITAVRNLKHEDIRFTNKNHFTF